MSESERKSAVGVLDSISEKPTGWTDIMVRFDGRENTTRLSTKKQELVELARAAGTERMEWTFTEKDSGTPNPHRPGSNFLNRYFEAVAPPGSEAAASPGLPPAVASGTSDQDRQRLIVRQSSLNRAVDVYGFQLGANDADNEMMLGKIFETAGRFERWVCRGTALEEDFPAD